MYTELHAASAFSFLEGASVPEELVEVCARLGMGRMALLDRDGVYGSPRFHLTAKKIGLKAHIGAEVTVSSFKCPVSSGRAESGGSAGEPVSRSSFFVSRQEQQRPAKKHNFSKLETRKSKLLQPTRLPLLVSSRGGYQNLCRLITRMKLRGPKDAEPEVIAAASDDLLEFASGLVCLTGDESGPLAAALARGGMEEGRRTVERLVHTFGRENVYIELQRHHVREEESRNQAAIAIARQLGLPLVATNGVRYAVPERRQILDAFTALRNYTTLESAGRLLSANSER
ncbi:MAG: PHP domain-containing protein, partial [Acidobacteriaceae bacterium]|nr:PHP domain-containing protein [Acidobacteriaceae bacterium]